MAEEVRRLASKTMEFTENIDRVLKEIELRIQSAKEHIEEVAKGANVQKDQASDVEELFYLVQYRMEALKGKYEKVKLRGSVVRSSDDVTVVEIEEGNSDMIELAQRVYLDIFLKVQRGS